MPQQQNNAIMLKGEKMIMPLIAFDTLEFVKDLEEAGFEPKMAEAQAKAQVKILSNLVDSHKNISTVVLIGLVISNEL